MTRSHTAQELRAMFKFDDRVVWISSNKEKEGVVVGVVPPGRLPGNVGFTEVGKDSLPRDHVSYVIRGGEPGQKTSVYWPRVSLLKAAGGLTTKELAWCQANFEKVRALISSTRSCASAAMAISTFSHGRGGARAMTPAEIADRERQLRGRRRPDAGSVPADVTPKPKSPAPGLVSTVERD